MGEITCTSSSGGSSSGGLSDATVCGEAWACGSTGTEEPISDLTVGAGTSGSEEPIRP